MKAVHPYKFLRCISLIVCCYCSLHLSFSQCWVFEKSGTTVSLHSVTFIDSSTGFVAGDGGTILRTTDAGITWKKILTMISNPVDFVDVSFINANIGTAVGGLGVGMHTTNSGFSWTQQSIRGGFSIFNIALLNANLAVAGSSRGIYRTVNDGQSWYQVSSVTDVRDFSFLNSSTGAAATSSEGVLLTTDGGTSWISKNIGYSNFLYGVSVSGDNIITAVGENLIVRTTDGGNSWSRQFGDTSHAENYVSVSFADSTHGVIVRNLGGGPFADLRAFYSTTDGGNNWHTMRSPNIEFFSVSYPTVNAVYAVGENGTIIKMINDCPPIPTAVFPLNGTTHQTVTQENGGGFSVNLLWNYPDYITVSSKRVQASTDSTFLTEILLDTTVIQGNTPKPKSILLKNIFTQRTYYWRMKVDYFDGSSTGWLEPWSFTTSGGSISGSLFNDDNTDSTRNLGETGLVNWRIDISGKIQSSVYTDANGRYSLSGLDSGTYTITQQNQAVWRRTFPSANSYLITLGINDSIGGFDFGDSYPWNSMNGTLYYDRNENGQRDAWELGMAHWMVVLQGDTSSDAVYSDSTGHFDFHHVAPGTNSITLAMPVGWEQIYPYFQSGYSFDIQTYGETYGGYDFGVHPISVRVKVPLTIHDNTSFASRVIWFGVRPGVTYGIWGVDPKATNFDFSESEFEIPPATPGLFDARFQDPHGGLLHFGFGSWTDMRDFNYSSQSDTFLITFSPSYLYGGDYPMTLTWSSTDVENGFLGQSFLIEPNGREISLASCCGQIINVEITDPSISSVRIVTRNPNISPAYGRLWNLISLPQAVANGFISNVFPTSNSHGFGYVAGHGYVIRDTLTTGQGYWLHYLRRVDSLAIIPTARMVDSISIDVGWNIVGSLSAPVDVNTITTSPTGILKSNFFGYDRGYAIAETLRPTQGYWIKASQAGKVILNASNVVSVMKLEKPNSFLRQSDKLIFRDHAGNEQTLYVLQRSGKGQATDLDFYTAPPLPPEGSFDIRFASGLLLATHITMEENEIPISISSAQYPLIINWEVKESNDGASLMIGSKEMPMKKGGSVQVESQGVFVKLKFSGSLPLPQNFSLEQNYPNPFNPVTVLRYELPVESRVVLKIIDLLGREVKTLVDGTQDAGYKSVEWNATNAFGDPVASGMYFYRLETVDARDPNRSLTQVKKMLLIK